jgi:hypothetical protein
LEMLGVLVLGFGGFLSFCVGVWVSCGGLLTVGVLVLFLCWCAGNGGVGVCVFFLLGVGLRREVARRFINWISALRT